MNETPTTSTTNNFFSFFLFHFHFYFMGAVKLELPEFEHIYIINRLFNVTIQHLLLSQLINLNHQTTQKKLHNSEN